MIRRRAVPDGLPFRVYERFGKRVYSIGYKLRNGRWAFRYECQVADTRQIAQLRKKALIESSKVENDAPIGGFTGLVNAWFKWQEELPASDKRKRADSTITENRREADNLVAAWGHFEPREITKAMGYDYLEACLHTTDDAGNPRPRAEKGNKEMALARLVLEYGIRRKMLDANPLAGLTKNQIKRTRRRVTAQEMALAVETGRRMGGARHIVAMALRTAWLCVRRSVEVRGITRDAVTEDGILWRDGKDSSKPAVLIEWSPELRATVDEAQAIKRFHVAGTMFLFGNMRGQRYTKGGWKAILHDLMTECEKVAAERKIPFTKFSLQDCRPMGVSDKLERGDTDTQAATGHTDGKMIAKVYDRRSQKRAKPAA
jgi:integrase